MTRRRHLLDGTAWGLLAEGLALPTGLITVIYLTRALGADGYGLYTLTVGLVMIVLGGIGSLLSRASIKFVSQADDWEPHFRTVKAILLRIYEGTDLINLHLYYADVDQKVSKSPRINELARWQLDHADNVTSLYGLNISVADEVYRRLLVLLDGTRNLSKLRVEMGQFIEKLDDFNGKDDLLRDLDKWMEESLNEVGKLGLFSS